LLTFLKGARKIAVLHLDMEKVFALLEKGMSLAEAKKKLSFNN